MYRAKALVIIEPRLRDYRSDAISEYLCIKQYTTVLDGWSELPFWLTDGFWSLFWKVEVTVCIHVTHV